MAKQEKNTEAVAEQAPSGTVQIEASTKLKKDELDAGTYESSPYLSEDGKSLEVEGIEIPMPGTAQEMIDVWGDEAVHDFVSRAVVIKAQGRLRSHLRANSSLEAINAELNTFDPRENARPSRDPLASVRNAAAKGDLSEEQKAEMRKILGLD